MSGDLSIQYLGNRAEGCAALANMRERGRIVKTSGRGITLRLRSSIGCSLVLSDEGGHFVAALSRQRRTTPWVALLRGSDSERMKPWLESSRSRSWFRRLMSSADALVVSSDGAAAMWKRWLPEAEHRIFRVYPYIDRSFEKVAEPRGEARSPIRVSLIGQARSRTELGVFRSVLDSFVQRCPELRSSVELSTPGSWSHQDLVWAKREGIPLLSKKEDEGDLIVLVDSATNEDTLPRGMFRALRSGRPILCLSRSDEAHRLLTTTGLGLHVDCSVHGWAERGACVIQRAVFRRALRRGLLAEYAPRPAAIARFSTQSYCDEIEAICRSVLLGPGRLSSPPMAPEFGQTHALEQSMGE